jgi:catechol 2,3-dioxygenase-like lactoylglutathione lyase family enzyme
MSKLDLDHVGVAVRDLDAAAVQFERLGFRLTPRGYHTLPAAPDGTRARLGTGNNCAMLEHGYIELIGITGPNYSGRLQTDLDRYEGVHIIAFGTQDSEATVQSLRRSGIPADVRLLERPIDHEGDTELAQFEIIEFGDALPELYAFAIHHATPEALWKPELLVHPNGAKSLEGITIAVSDSRNLAQRLRRVLGNASDSATGVIDLRRGMVRLVDEGWVATNYRGPPLPTPAVVAITLGTENLDRTADVLRARGVDIEREKGRLIVAPAYASGAMIEFVPV